MSATAHMSNNNNNNNNNTNDTNDTKETNKANDNNDNNEDTLHKEGKFVRCRALNCENWESKNIRFNRCSRCGAKYCSRYCLVLSCLVYTEEEKKREEKKRKKREEGYIIHHT
jgi:hypothetical protein